MRVSPGARRSHGLSLALLVAGIALTRAHAQTFDVHAYRDAPQSCVLTWYAVDPLTARYHMDAGVNSVPDPATGKTPLMLAVEAGNSEDILFLLAHGADPSARDKAGDTAIDLARHSSIPRIREILELDCALNPPPSKYYAGRTPLLSILDGQYQTGTPLWALPRRLCIAVTDHSGRPMQNAPVTIIADHNGGRLFTCGSGPGDLSLLLRSDSHGLCRFYFCSPDAHSVQSTITALAGIESHQQAVVFTELTTRIEDKYPIDAFNISNCIGDIEGSASSLTWQNPGTDVAWHALTMDYSDGSYRVIKYLPGNATSSSFSMDEYDW
jgi:hypothetical protein